ncbi:MAG: radical SAM protein [Dehalococcoidales bacterium]|nr:radical SAM protein [Dehalococcoidales bacterium]MDZ4230493.1 radical SAM protein [Dehalococcoidales bacterium]
MLKIALVNPPQFTRYPQPPMGLAQLAAVLEEKGYPVIIVDANALNLQPEAVVPLVGNADIIGLTAMTPTINSAMATARHLKKARPDLPVVLGGAHATLLPEKTLLAAPEIDLIVRGEGEETLIEMLEALESNQALSEIQGISHRQNGKVVSNPLRSKTVDLDSLPFLAYHLLPRRKYKPHPPHGRALPFAAIITSRGCPYQCSYCSKPIFGKKFRAQSPERVVEELTYYQDKLGIKEFAFYDDVFTLDKKRAFAIAERMMQKGLSMHWTCETRVNLVDRELLCQLKRAGCYAIAYGIESGSQEILDTIDKNITLEQVEETINLNREVGLQTIGYFMIGSPGETPETIRQTIQFAKKLKLDFAQFAITTPFPGTKLHDLYLNGKKGDDIPWESFVYAGTGGGKAPVFESSRLGRDEIQCWARQAYREFYLRPSYPWQRIRQTRSFGDLKMNAKGLAMLLENIKK